MTLRPCPECGGARLKPTSLAVTVGDTNIAEMTRLSVDAGDRLRRPPQLTEPSAPIGARILKEIRERLRS